MADHEALPLLRASLLKREDILFVCGILEGVAGRPENEKEAEGYREALCNIAPERLARIVPGALLLLRALACAAAQWQPVTETEPVVGVPVLGWIAERNRALLVERHPPGEGWWPPAPSTGPVERPSHFMPLPEAPDTGGHP